MNRHTNKGAINIRKLTHRAGRTPSSPHGVWNPIEWFGSHTPRGEDHILPAWCVTPPWRRPPPAVCDETQNLNDTSLDWNDVSLPSHCWTNGWQPSKTIVTNGWLSEKPLKNHWHQWLSWYHFINGNGDPKNHWFLAMVLNFLLYFLAKAKIKQDFKKYVDNMF